MHQIIVSEYKCSRDSQEQNILGLKRKGAHCYLTTGLAVYRKKSCFQKKLKGLEEKMRSG